MKFLWIGVSFVVSLLTGTTIAQSALQSYNVDKDSITVSGLSSGGAMAMQFHVAFSSEVNAAGIYAGLPYACAKGGLTSANLCMYSPTTIVVANLAKEIRDQASANNIDSVSNLNGDKVFVFHGTKDATVNPQAGHKTQQLYEEFGAVVETEYDTAAAHGFPTDFYGAACSTTSSATHYINNCDYHGAFIGLNVLYNKSLQAVKKDRSNTFAGQLLQFDQREFGGSAATSMDTTGYVYIPSGCQDRNTQCKLHISFHGCHQAKSNLNDIYATKTGYIEVAETNNIIILFPQATANLLQGNPNACWDWWGYLNVNFINKNGAQMKAVHQMMTRVADCDPSHGCTPSATTPSQTTLPPTASTPPGGSSPATEAPGDCKDNDVSLHPFPGNCQYYTVCACGASVLMDCAPGLYFDRKINKCNLMQLVPECN